MNLTYNDLKERKPKILRTRAAIQNTHRIGPVQRTKPRSDEETILIISNNVYRIDKAIEEGKWLVDFSEDRRRIVYNEKRIEDLLIDRLNSAKHWNDSRDFEQSAVLMTSYTDKIDWKYLEEKAKENDVFDKLEEIRTRISIMDFHEE